MPSVSFIERSELFIRSPPPQGGDPGALGRNWARFWLRSNVRPAGLLEFHDAKDARRNDTHSFDQLNLLTAFLLHFCLGIATGAKNDILKRQRRHTAGSFALWREHGQTRTVRHDFDRHVATPSAF